MDGVLIANELVDEAQKCRKSMVLFKVDFEKAYDSVDWKFLDYVMERMGFVAKWRSWISECLSFASVSVLVNGREIHFHPFCFYLLWKGLVPWSTKLLR